MRIPWRTIPRREGICDFVWLVVIANPRRRYSIYTNNLVVPRSVTPAACVLRSISTSFHLSTLLFHRPSQRTMATITAATAAPSVVRAALVNKGAARISSVPVLGLPQMKRDGKVRCSAEEKAPQVTSGKAAAMLAAVSAMAASSPALALVDERMTTEGTGLSLGLSNNLLGWILLGVFGLIWSFYIVYTSSLEEDEESGLSL